MIISELHVHHLRNIESARLQLHPRYNFFTGANGSGKTSLLEACYLLGSGHSFRSRDISSIISYQQDSLTVFARSFENDTISVEKSSSKPTRVKLNNQFCTSSSVLAYRLPIQLFYQDFFQIIDAGPTLRRCLIDWGLFHVKQNYLGMFNQYKRLIKQRNALLKQKGDSRLFNVLDKQISDTAQHLDHARYTYCEEWKTIFYSILKQLSEVDCTITYFKGWDKKGIGLSLFEVLQQGLASDQQRLYTQSGAHQADLIIEVAENKAKNTLSRGQQKIILIALKLSQAAMLNTSCLYLFDDLAAELDSDHQTRLLKLLSDDDNQMLFTSTTPLPIHHLLDNCHHFKVNAGTFEKNDSFS